MNGDSPRAKPAVWYLPPESHTRKVFRPQTYADLQEAFALSAPPGEQRVTAGEVTSGIAGYEAIVTGWGSPAFEPEAIARAGRLRIIAHSAGSVKSLFPDPEARRILLERGVAVSSANLAIAYNVAEATVGYLIAVSRNWLEQMIAIRETPHWGAPEIPKSGQYLRGATVGLVSASVVGREVIRLLQPFDVTILLYDPYLSEDEAEKLGVRKCGFPELLSASDFVSLHAPSIPETRHLIGADQLRMLRDGAILVNTSRGSVLDHQALLEEARTGRIRVVLDVTDPEPLPPEHPLRALPNVYLTPHVSGAGAYGYFRIGEMTLQALQDAFEGRPVRGAVDLHLWERLA